MIALQDVLKTFNVADAKALHDKYCEFDRAAFRNGKWNPENQSFICTKIKNLLLEVNVEELTDKDKGWILEILWFWHHHAISASLWRGLLQQARDYSFTALAFQAGKHDNQVTLALHLLIHNRFQDVAFLLEQVPECTIGDKRKSIMELLAEFQNAGSAEALVKEITK